MKLAWLALLVMGALVMGMGLLDRRWGKRSWRLRLLTGLAIAAGGLALLLRA